MHWVVILLLISLCNAQPRGYDSTACGNNECLDEDGPICYDGKCVECRPGDPCMCGPNEYCVADPNDKNFATCQSYGEPIGQRCDPSISISDVRRGSNDKLYCGKVFFNADGQVSGQEWQGFCNAGTCEICSIGSRYMNSRAFNCTDRTNSKCPGQGYTCMIGSYVYAPAGSYSWSYMFVNPVVFSTFWTWMWLYIFMPLTVLGIFLCKKMGIC